MGQYRFCMVYHGKIVLLNVRIKIMHYEYETYATMKIKEMPRTSKYSLCVRFTCSTQSVKNKQKNYTKVTKETGIP